MMIFAKMVIGGFIIGFASWLAGKLPHLAGFITALPLVSVVALVFAHQTHQDLEITSRYAQSIILAVPVSWLFFIPFFFPDRLGGFWPAWGLGLVLLAGGFFLHQWIVRMLV